MWLHNTVSLVSTIGAQQGGGASQSLNNRELCGLDDEVIGRSTDELPCRSDGLCGAHDPDLVLIVIVTRISARGLVRCRDADAGGS